MMTTALTTIFKIKYYDKPSLLVRIFAILLVALYIVFFYQVAFPWYAYTTKRFVFAFFVYLAYGLGCNIGLFLITTKKAKKMRVLTTMLYLPSSFITPLVVSVFIPYASAVLATFLLSLFIYYYFNPWRRNA